jgi:hypothetical protein
MITNILLILNLIFLVASALLLVATIIHIGNINRWRGSINKELDLISERFDLHHKHLKLISERLDVQNNHTLIVHKLIVKLAEQKNGEDDADYWKNN